ncbi:MAG TPA: hypothetical protein VHZ50_14870 [Puia sp.]|nr:hypothetical protein [Puia sp.]
MLSILFFLSVAYPSRYYFLNDDFEHIPLAAKGNFIFGSFARPIGDLSLWFDNKIWGKNAFGYHLTNIIIHLINSYFVYLLATQLFKLYTNGRDIFLKSWCAAMVFLIYAFHSEPVLWIICRTGSLSFLFFLLACLCYLKRNNIFSFLFSLLFFGFGLLSYESTWIYPAIAFFISATDIFLKRKKWSSEWIFPVATFLFFITYLICLKMIVGNIFSDYAMHNFYSFNISRLFLNYNSLLARTGLPYMNNSGLFSLIYFVSIAVISSVIFILYKRKKISPLSGLLIFAFLISPLPAISLGINTHNSESERYIYLPSMFCILLIIEIMFLLFSNKNLLTVMLTLFLLFHGYLFYRSAQSFSFAGDVIKKSLSAINTYSSVNVIHVINRPIQYKGAIMFRSDFQNALNWICSDCRYNKIDTISSFEYKRLAAFHIEKYKLDSLTKDFYKIKSAVNVNDMILNWTDSSLIIIK